MKRAPLSKIVLSSALLSLGMVCLTEPAAADKSGRGTGVSAGGASVSADRGGASVSAGGASVSADRGGASVSAGGASVSADRGGASVSAGDASVSADRGHASVTSDRGGATVSSGSISKKPGTETTATARPAGDRQYGSIREWFEDLRSSWFGAKSKRSDVVTGEVKRTTTSSSAREGTDSSGSSRIQVNRVVQEKSSTAIAADGGSASAEASNVNVTEQKN